MGTDGGTEVSLYNANTCVTHEWLFFTLSVQNVNCKYQKLMQSTSNKIDPSGFQGLGLPFSSSEPIAMLPVLSQLTC